MGKKSQVHQEQEANQQLKPHQDVQDQAHVNQPESPAIAARRAMNAPGKLAPKQILALQRTVGNRVVQRHLAAGHGALVKGQTSSAVEERVRAPSLAISYLAAATNNIVSGSEERS